ncbi:methyl-accepting chemotaxis protein [Bacillus sp. BGMRC 2118]|nr:methyl-accepting chemotaxis protein [Bacillus sp. BGMRC 2118]
MKIKGKLYILVFILIGAMLLVGIFSSIQLNKTTAAYNEMQEDEKIQLLFRSLQYRFTGISNDERAFLLTGDKELIQGIEEKEKDIESYFEELSQYEHVSSSDKEEISKIKNNLAIYLEENKQMVNTYLSGSTDLALSIHMKEQRSIRKELVDPSVNEFMDKLKSEIAEDKSNLTQSQKVETIILYSIIALSVVAGLIIGLIIIRSIVKPLTVMTGRLQEIAEGEGDLTQTIQINSKDELGLMAHSFNGMVGKIRELIKQVGMSAEQVAAAAEELTASSEETTRATEQIASTVQDVASGSTEQITSLKDTAITVSLLSTTVENIAENSEKATKTSNEASENAALGNEAIQNIIIQMTGINETVNQLSDEVTRLGDRSSQISEIVDSITGIADQTNLLALNAAIEAARAGEHGRGFAVVSDEVRKLAEQSAASAQQISALISTIQSDTVQTVESMRNTTDKVTEGISLVHNAGESFEQIQLSISKVSEQIQEVSNSVLEMRDGSRKMVDAIQTYEHISEVTDQGTQEMASAAEEQVASMEEIAASSASLSKMAEDLQTLIGKFKV